MKKIYYGWKENGSEIWKKIQWVHDKYAPPQQSYNNMEKFKKSITKEAKKSWYAIIHDNQWVVDRGNNINPFKQLK